MAGYRADKDVTNNGPRGVDGSSWEFDKRTGKWGTRYADGEFWQAPDEKQPGYRPPQKEEPVSAEPAEPAGPSPYDQAVDGFMGGIGSMFSGAADMTWKTIKALLGFAVLSKFTKELAENPGDVGGAAAKTGRAILCFIGIGVDYFAIAGCIPLRANAANPLMRILFTAALALEIYAILGLLRVAGGKPFWIDLAVFRKVRTIRVPKIAYVGIELLVTVLMTKPVLNWINSFTIEWARQNQDASNSLIIALGLGMLVGSVLIAAIIGLIVCKLIKAVTAK